MRRMGNCAICKRVEEEQQRAKWIGEKENRMPGGRGGGTGGTMGGAPSMGMGRGSGEGEVRGGMFR